MATGRQIAHLPHTFQIEVHADFGIHQRDVFIGLAVTGAKMHAQLTDIVKNDIESRRHRQIETMSTCDARQRTFDTTARKLFCRLIAELFGTTLDRHVAQVIHDRVLHFFERKGLGFDGHGQRPLEMTGGHTHRNTGSLIDKRRISRHRKNANPRLALASHLDETAYFIMLHFPVMEEKQLLRRAGVKFESLQEMLKSIHNPKTKQEGMEGLAAARAIAAFEVVFYAERQMVRKPNPVASIRVDLQHIEELKSKFPFNLTKHQDDGITDIVTDLRRPYRMNRLLSGDVGYGKTEVALIPAIAARAAGAKVAIMCPSLLIVNQWAEKIKGYGSKIPVCVIAGNGKASKAENITKAKLDSNPIMVGTTALITRLPKLDWTPDFVILDEQQKHGKNHKDTITGPNTNRLEATATCQPKTSAMVNYGGMDESILNQCPVDKQITTRIVLKEDKERMFSHIKRIMTDIKDSQIAVVYPSVSQEDEKTSLIAASATWEKLFPGQIGVLHGGMTDDEKVEVIRKMHNLEIRILCASVLIETGLTLPSLRGMVVVSADRFGVSALHQLRGRLARHGGQGYFHMYVPDEDISPDTISRLKLLENHTDGFVLAEKDAEMRGYGSISEDDDDQSGVSKSTLFYNLKLMPKDIETVARNRKLLI